ncbi:MAG: competence/damage-inducible protein A [Sphingobacteriaceae bacterium]
MLAEIITIGDELLIGQIIDTNSAWMAQKLNLIGVRLKQITSVSDDREHILSALKEASKRADIIFLTGGLGPTKDDITKKTLADYFQVGLVRNTKALANVARIFERVNNPLLEINLHQADVPENCEVLLNDHGTAPGMWFNHLDKIYISMPGVPFEMMYMMEESVIPKLIERFNLPPVVHKNILTVGIGESFLAETIADIESMLPAYIKLAYLPRLGQVRLRLSATDSNHANIEQEVEAFAEKIINRISEYVVTDKDVPMEKALMDEMAEMNITLSLAESCTGGYIAHLFTQHAGASKVLLGGAVSYSNALKEIMLGVQQETLMKYGAVSEETVKEMASGAISRFKSDYAIAVTGIAGPDGGTPGKPVGTVWIAVAHGSGTIAKKFVFGKKRQQNIERAAINALAMLLKLIRVKEY